jgi:hypothetical protein
MKTVLIAATGMALLGGAAQAATPSFTSDVAPILQRNCLACHSSAAKMGGLVMDKFDLLMKGGAHGPVIIPGKSEKSRMVMMLEGKMQPRMPYGGDPLPTSRRSKRGSMLAARHRQPEKQRRSHRWPYRTLNPKCPWFRPSHRSGSPQTEGFWR